ncbi:MAG TPA: MATE family efflux transporter [Clostridiales bacterium]|jgi:putative MATE family efflux protein|nr:MATE family efflux transporter [Clostridiales bacterium]
MDYIGKRELILKGKMARVILLLSAPIMLNNLIQTIYDLTDTYWVSKIGSTQVAAITLIWPVIFLMISLGMGVGIGGTALISQYVGSGQPTQARDVAGQIITFSFLSSLLIGLAGALFSTQIVSGMGGTGELLQEASDYLRIIFIGLPTMFLFFAYTAIQQGQGDTMTPMKFGALSVFLNIILDPIFIFTFGLGISGAAYATVIARGLFAVISISRLFKYSDGIHLNRSHLGLNKPVLKNLLKIALPSSVGRSTEAFGFVILTVFIMSFGENTMAAFGIGNRINSMILMPAMGISVALTTVIGQNLGANNIERAKQAIKTSIQLTMVFLVIGGTVIFTSAVSIVGIFTTDMEVLSQGSFYLRAMTLSLPFMGFFSIFIGTFQGSGHTVSAMVMMSGRLWALRIPLILIFKNYTNLAEKSVWFAMVLSNAIICLVGLIIYSTGRWQKPVIQNEKGDVTNLL